MSLPSEKPIEASEEPIEASEAQASDDQLLSVVSLDRPGDRAPSWRPWDGAS